MPLTVEGMEVFPVSWNIRGGAALCPGVDGHVWLLDVASLTEMVQGFVRASENFGCRLGDERRWDALARPDDVDLFPALEGVVELAFDAAAQSRLPIR